MLNVSIGYKALFCDSVNQAYRLHLRTVVENLMNITSFTLCSNIRLQEEEKKKYISGLKGNVEYHPACANRLN